MTPTSPPTRMRAAQLTKYNAPYQLVEIAVPKIGPNELLVQVLAVGFCHSDMQVVNGEFPSQLPMIPLHEPVGIVVQVGAACANKWQLGQRVGVLNYKNACTRCAGCVLSLRRCGNLDPRLCENRQMAGFFHDGGLGEYMVADSTTTVSLPAKLPFDQAAPLMCAGATVWAALEKATEGLEVGATIGIVGIGGLGYLGLQFARHLGFSTVAIESRAQARELATALPPDLAPKLIADPGAANASMHLKAVTSGEGLAAVVVCTDSIDAVSWSLSLLRHGGVLVPLGVPQEKWQFDPSLLLFKELSIRGSYIGSVASVQRMMDVVSSKPVQSEITRVDFKDATTLVDRYRSHNFSGRLVVVLPERSSN